MRLHNAILFVITFLAGTLSAETNFYARLELTAPDVFLGEVFPVNIIIHAPEQPHFIPDRSVHDFHLRPLGEATALNVTHIWHFRFSAIAKRGGAFDFPVLHFRSGSLALKTAPLPIHVAKPARSDKMELTSILATNQVFVGEPVRLRTLWDSTLPFNLLRAVDLHFPVLNVEALQVLDPHEPGRETQKEATGLPVHGTRVLASRSTIQRGDVTHQTLQFDKILIPQRSGTLTLPSSTLLCAEKLHPQGNQIGSGFQYPAYFNNTFFEQDVNDGAFQRIFTDTAPIELEVIPLPLEGRPEDFFGLVGRFRFEVTADPVSVQQGGTVRLSVTIHSDYGVMEHITFPDLETQTHLSPDFRPVADHGLPVLGERSKTFTQSIRVLNAEVLEIPSLTFSFFDPTTQSYQSLESKPIPLLVTPQDQESPLSETVHFEPEQTPEFAARPIVPSFIFWTLGACVALASFVFGLTRLLGCASFQRRIAIHCFCRGLRKILRGSDNKKRVYGILDDRLRTYFAAHMTASPGTLTFSEALEMLVCKELDPDCLNDVADLFVRCDAYRFTCSFDESVDPTSLYRDSCRILHQVEAGIREKIV